VEYLYESEYNLRRAPFATAARHLSRTGVRMAGGPITRSARARGALLGALAGGGPAPLLEILADELAEGRTDVRRLAERWIERHRADPGALDSETAAGLEFLASHGAPRREGGVGSAALARTVPVALVAFGSPRTLVSATVHLAALTHPAPEAAWGAVAVNVALGSLLRERRDFVPDVIEALAGNGAPERLLAVVRRVPLGRREQLPEPDSAAGDAIAGVALALGLAYHEPLATRGFDRLLERGPTAAGAAAGALLGARDGDAAVPTRWLDPERAALWTDLAERMLRHSPAAA